MLRKVLENSNVKRAYRQVVSNGGSAGVDGVKTGELSLYMHENWERIQQEITEGRYFPEAVLGIEIPKSNGEKTSVGHSNGNRSLNSAKHQSDFANSI